MKRQYHHFSTWEDWRDGQYRQSPGDSSEMIISRAARLLSDPVMLKAYMRLVAANWQFSSLQNMTNRNRNRQAWLGQAACSLAVGASEDMTKAAWRTLTAAEQIEANEVADTVILEWENKYAEKETRN